MEAKDGDSAELELHSRDERTHEPAVFRREVLRPPLALFDESEPELSLGLWESVQNPCVPVPHDNWATEIADSGHGCSWFGPEATSPKHTSSSTWLSSSSASTASSAARLP